MMYLLDVNVLIALAVGAHQFHNRVARWLITDDVRGIATCSITELGFLRIMLQASTYRLSFEEARSSLAKLLASPRLNHTFLADHHDIRHLPAWVTSSKQITDGHLVRLAESYGATLATLDERIPGAVLIPAS